MDAAAARSFYLDAERGAVLAVLVIMFVMFLVVTVDRLTTSSAIDHDVTTATTVPVTSPAQP